MKTDKDRPVSPEENDSTLTKQKRYGWLCWTRSLPFEVSFWAWPRLCFPWTQNPISCRNTKFTLLYNEHLTELRQQWRMGGSWAGRLSRTQPGYNQDDTIKCCHSPPALIKTISQGRWSIHFFYYLKLLYTTPWHTAEKSIHKHK